MASQPPDVMERAAFWVVQLRSPERPQGCEIEFADWLRASPIHVLEYLRAAEVWEALAHPDSSAGQPAEDLVREAADSNLIGWPGQKPGRRPGSSRIALGWHAIGLTVALVIAGLCAIPGWRCLSVREVTTGVGELRSAVLPDHSIVELNTQSEIRIAFSDSERRVELVRGEAFFVVEKNHSRPFVVSTDALTARAVGTRFSVYRRAAGTVVTVAEGKVLVRDAIEVTPGDQAEAQPGQPVVMHHADVQRSLAWRERRLIFKGEPLAHVVEEFNRYNLMSLVIVDERLQHERISGVFDANDPESLLDFLVKVDHIPVSRVAQGSVRIGENRNPSDK